MATNRDLLKEAIADAKAVKEMAIANAKMALEEAFTPQLKSMLATKLQEMEDEDLNEVDYTMGNEDDSNQLPNPPEELNIDINEEDEMEEELNLDELLAELNEAEDEEDMEDEAEEAEEDMESETEEESMDLEDMSEEDLKSFIEDVIADMVKAGELEAGEDMEGEDMEGEDMEGEDMEDEEEEEVNIDELLSEIDSMDEMYSDEGMEVEELEEVSELGMTDMEFLISLLTPVLVIATGYARGVIKDKLQKAKNAKELKAKAEEIAKESEDMKSEGVETLRNELNEVNLLNAKLLYTNKIFKGKNLTESQKVKVLNSFDKTTTVKEVKLVYETLSGGITTSKKSLSENLGSASKAMGTTKKPIIEANDAFSRMREIAFYSAKH
jgi:hypothetical protein